jgi:hypothetical protein
MREIEFIVRGTTGIECSNELERLYNLWLKDPLPMIEDREKEGPLLRVIITDPVSDRSVEQCVSYAKGELADDIVSAGGTIWDGTHVQILRDEE